MNEAWDCVWGLWAFEVVLESGIEGVEVADEEEGKDADNEMVGGGGWNVAWRASCVGLDVNTAPMRT